MQATIQQHRIYIEEEVVNVLHGGLKVTNPQLMWKTRAFVEARAINCRAFSHELLRYHETYLLPHPSLRLRPHLPAHEGLQRVAHRLRLVHDPIHFETDRHLDALALGDETHGGSRGDALDDLANGVLSIFERAAAAERESHPPVARLIVGAGEYQIAERRESHESLALCAERETDPRHLREPAGDQRHARVGAESHAVGDPGADGDHVLDGAAHLDPDDVRLRIGAKLRSPPGQ